LIFSASALPLSKSDFNPDRALFPTFLNALFIASSAFPPLINVFLTELICAIFYFVLRPLIASSQAKQGKAVD
jgi:hypothetical protein